MSVRRPESFCLTFSTSPAFHLPTSVPDLPVMLQQGIHRSFAFRSNPGFIFHDSPGFETGDEKQLQEVLSFLEEKAKSTDVDDQLHAIWSVSLFSVHTDH